MFTKKELAKLEGLVWYEIDEVDFELQDEDYQEFMKSLHEKISTKLADTDND